MTLNPRLLIAAAALAGLSGCHESGRSETRDPGPQASRTYQLGTFDRIEVSGPYELKVSTGSAPSASATGGSDLLDHTEVVVEDGTLKIRPEKRDGTRVQWSSGKATFTISTAAIRGIAIAGSGDVALDKSSGDFRGDVAGSGSIAIASMNGGTAGFDIGGSGGIKVAGTADALDVSIAGSGDVDASALKATAADISIAGSGNVRAHATGTADVTIMGGGDVDISGGAKCTTSKMGGGRVRCS